ncbi:unnamed protein product [Protopolystoma xenopodis]|uniref:MROH2B-like HEAT-repeats domain-containing protein n=1 Tax=Protopolystoma xenopodis TaxID=117903 RepID=A0A3S4ZC75_9PLAT|nr:unnamed protein product [Protopolystoma xenopodis]
MFRYFGSFSVHASAESLVFLDSWADFYSSFTGILLCTVTAFDAISSRVIQFVLLLVLRRQTVEKCRLLHLHHLIRNIINEFHISDLLETQIPRLCDRILQLAATTVGPMRHVLWPFVLELLVPAECTDSVAAICQVITNLVKEPSYSEFALPETCLEPGGPLEDRDFAPFRLPPDMAKDLSECGEL